MISIEQMQYILELSKTHSFHKTAENLYISQPAVSKAIKKAEDELEVRLFERNPAGVYPTQAGIEILKLVDEILRRVNDLYLTANHFSFHQQENNKISIRIYSHNTIGNYVLPQIVTGLHSYIADLDLQVIEALPEEALEAIKADPTGIGLGIFECAASPKLTQSYCLTKLCSAEPFLVVNKEMTPLNLTAGERVTLKKLSEYPLVLNQFSPPLSSVLLNKMQEKGYQPKIILRCPTAAIFTNYVIEGLACGIVTRLGHFFTFPPLLPDIEYFPIESDYQFDFLLYAHAQFPSQLYQLFYHLLHRLLMLN